MKKEIFSKSETCEFLGICLATLNKLMKENDIPYSKIGSRNSKVFFKKTDLENWLASKIQINIRDKWEFVSDDENL